MKKLIVVLPFLAAGCSGAAPPKAAANAPLHQATLDVPGRPPVMALRLPARGGIVRAYALPALDPSDWTSGRPTIAAHAAVAMDPSGSRLLFRERNGAIEEFDLVGAHDRVIAPRGRWFTAMATDTLLAVSASGQVLESEPWGTHPWPTTVGTGIRAAFAGLGSRLLLLRHDSLAVATREAGVTLAVPVPAHAKVAASRNGDAVAFATDSGLVVLEARYQWHPWFVRLTGSPTDVAFSPSGHRLYVTLESKSELAVVDRFDRRELPSIPLPAPAAAVRVDPWGRAVMVRPANAGPRHATWVVGIATGRLTGRFNTEWESDLPTVAEDGALLYRDGTAVVARDIRTLDSLGAVPGGAADLWFVGRWKPIMAGAAARLEARSADTTAAETTAVAVQPPSPPAPPPESLWVQLSLSQSEGGARALAMTLSHEGHAALVAAPDPAVKGWRVLLGPFPSRAVADSVARSLARPYWITAHGPGGAAAR